MCGAFDKCDQDSVMIPIFIKRKRSFKSNDLQMIYVFCYVTEHKFASEKRGMPKLR